MSPDEVFALVVCLIISLIGWISWYYRLARATGVGWSQRARALLYLTPLGCALALWLVLRNFASFDVRDSGVYLFFYMVMGAAWVSIWARFFAWFGVSLRRDAIERRNRAATAALIGAMLGLTLCFAGANIGDGPGWWVVVFCAALSTGAFFVFWAAIEWFTHDADSISIARDTATGIRLGCLLAGLGLMLARSVAGNWTSAAAAVGDFLAVAWPVLLLAAPAALLDRVLAPSPTSPKRSVIFAGIIPGVIYLILSGIFVAAIGLW